MEFRVFLETEEKKNVKNLLKMIPAGHRKLLDGYRFRYTPGNTLNGDKNHIGYIHHDKIVVAAPWNYSRGFTTLHEIAHLVWEKLMTKELKKEWSKLVKETKKQQMAKFDRPAQKKSLDQEDEEIFCMSYAAKYCNHAPAIWQNGGWFSFLDKIAKLQKD
jgi:hypothetical protein